MRSFPYIAMCSLLLSACSGGGLGSGQAGSDGMDEPGMHAGGAGHGAGTAPDGRGGASASGGASAEGLPPGRSGGTGGGGSASGGTGGESSDGSGGSTTAPGEVLWYADPSKSLTSQFYALSKQSELDCDTPPPTEESSAATFNDPTHGASWRVVKALNRKRAELSRTSGLKFEVGTTYFIGWRARFNINPDLGAGFAVMQWKSEGDPNLQNYPFNMDYNGTTLTLNAFTAEPVQGTFSQSSRRATIWKTNIAENTWQEFVFKVHVSDDPKKGTVEFWHNGVAQDLTCDDKATRSVCTLNGDKQLVHRTFDGDNVYLKWGAYGKASCVSKITVDLNAMRVGTSFDVVAP